jgi:hypothetical protein
MIRYALHCADCGHDYEEWFENMADYDAKKTAGIACPSCGGGKVAKAIMAPSVGKAKAAAAAPACAPGGCAGAGCPMMQQMMG